MPRTPSLVLEAESPAPAPRAQFSEAGSPTGCLASPQGLPPRSLPRVPAASPGVAAAPTSPPQSCGPS